MSEETKSPTPPPTGQPKPAVGDPVPGTVQSTPVHKPEGAAPAKPAGPAPLAWDSPTVAKLKAANKKVAAKLRCYEKAVVEGKRVSSVCLLAADDHFLVAFAKAELKGGCATTGDQVELEARVDGFVVGLLDTLAGGH